MGGELISQILEDGKTKSNNVRKFILEANTKISFLREYLFNNNYEIISEKIVKENNKYYELILCKKTNVSIKYDIYDLMFGPVLRKEKSPLFIEKWTKVLNDYKRIIENSSLKPIKLIEECKLIEDVI